MAKSSDVLMPLFYQHNINASTKIGVWHITEDEGFFLQKVTLQKNITHWHKRLQHLAGRYLLPYLFPGFPHQLILIADTRKPYLPGEEFHFSISHCGDFAAVMVSKHQRVGVDIELVSSKVGLISHKFLNDDELPKPSLGACQQNTPDLQKLTLLWCCKEAVFKWYGNGGVDFKNHIHLGHRRGEKTPGVITSFFLKDEPVALDIHYKLFDGMCLAWVA
ncbi:MAG: 4'-phosphopantetheinyl transferase superfamily protein [Ginsengibacter sp.]